MLLLRPALVENYRVRGRRCFSTGGGNASVIPRSHCTQIAAPYYPKDERNYVRNNWQMDQIRMIKTPPHAKSGTSRRRYRLHSAPVYLYGPWISSTEPWILIHARAHPCRLSPRRLVAAETFGRSRCPRPFVLAEPPGNRQVERPTGGV